MFLKYLFLQSEANHITRTVAELKKAHNGAHNKHRPKIAGGGQNLPLAILRCLTEWVSVIDDRSTMNGRLLALRYQSKFF